MSHLSLTEAFELAMKQAPGITEDQFLEQTRLALLQGRIKGKALDCVYWHDPEDLGTIRPSQRPGAGHHPKEIGPEEWRRLSLFIEHGMGSACAWGHDRAAPIFHDVEIDGNFEGLPVYSDVILLASDFAGIWTSEKLSPVTMTDADLRNWCLKYEADHGEPPTIRYGGKCADLKERGVNSSQWRRVWSELYKGRKRGRREKKK